MSRIVHKDSQFISLQEKAPGTDQSISRQKPPPRAYSAISALCALFNILALCLIAAVALQLTN